MQFITKPWKNQKELVEHVEANDLNYWGLLWDMGTGKTKGLIDLLRLACFKLNRVPKTLIIGPSAVQDNWAREIVVHSNIPAKAIAIVDGTTKPDGKKNKNPTKKLKLQQLASGADIFIITKDTVNGKDTWDAIEKLGIEFIAVDEVQHFKDPQGKRVRALHKLTHQKQLKYRFILTGSPVLQNALDLWSQFYILNPKILGANFYSFRAQYFYDENADMPSHIHFPSWVPKDEKYFNKMRELGIPEAELEKMTLNNLNQVIYRHASRVMKSDILDLPDRTYQVLKVGMKKDQRKMYEEFRDGLVTMLDRPDAKTRVDLEKLLDGPLLEENLPELMSADLAIVKTLRLMQLACGIFTSDEGEVTVTETERLNVLRGTLEEILHGDPTNKVIVWTVFTPTYEQIAKVCYELNAPAVFLNGTQSKDQKQEAIDIFQTSTRTRVIIANPAAGGTGVNLTAANYEVCYSRGFKLGDWLQADARAYRGGQTRKTTRIDLVTPDTIDEKCFDRLKEKASHAEDILARKDFTREEILGML